MFRHNEFWIATLSLVFILSVFQLVSMQSLAIGTFKVAMGATAGAIVGSIFDKPFPEENWRNDIPSTIGAMLGAITAYKIF
jgi:hypothetical protein